MSWKRPGMMYVRERRADSICDTCAELALTKEEYEESHCEGSWR